MSKDRIRRLDLLDFNWSRQAYDAAWEKHFRELKAFQKRYGHCNVSTKSKTHAALGNWVRRQRQLKRHGKLSPERIERLDVLGFRWNMKSGEVADSGWMELTGRQCPGQGPAGCLAAG